MSRQVLVISTFVCAVGLCAAASEVAGQQQAIEPEGLKVFNRSVSSLSDGARKGVRLSEHAGDGVAYLQGVEFTNGTIELDVRGKDVPQQSFVGVAFHGVDGTTYDAIYFRPFNFRAEDPARRGHAVQYIAQPIYPWQKLRAEQPGLAPHGLRGLVPRHGTLPEVRLIRHVAGQRGVVTEHRVLGHRLPGAHGLEERPQMCPRVVELGPAERDRFGQRSLAKLRI